MFVVQSCLTLCNPMDCSPPGSSVHGIFQAIVLEWIAISFSNIYVYMYMKVKSVSGSVMPDSLQPHGLSMEFSRQEYWNGWSFPSLGDLPDPGIESRSAASQAVSLVSESYASSIFSFWRPLYNPFHT